MSCKKTGPAGITLRERDVVDEKLPVVRTGFDRASHGDSLWPRARNAGQDERVRSGLAVVSADVVSGIHDSRRTNRTLRGRGGDCSGVPDASGKRMVWAHSGG